MSDHVGSIFSFVGDSFSFRRGTWPSGRASEFRVLSSSKTHLTPPESCMVNTQDTVALSRHDRKMIIKTLPSGRALGFRIDRFLLCV